jgi:carbonic anhydrase
VLSVLHYAVEVLDVAHVIVVGHYGCGGVAAAMGHGSNGVVDHWLGNIRNVIRWNQRELDAIADPEERTARLVELNVIEQVHHLSRTPIIRDAWVRGRRPTLHGLVYGMTDGLLRTLVTGVDGVKDAQALLDEPPLPDVVSDAPPDGAGSAGGPVVRRQPAMVGPEA